MGQVPALFKIQVSHQLPAVFRQQALRFAYSFLGWHKPAPVSPCTPGFHGYTGGCEDKLNKSKIIKTSVAYKE